MKWDFPVKSSLNGLFMSLHCWLSFFAWDHFSCYIFLWLMKKLSDLFYWKKGWKKICDFWIEWNLFLCKRNTCLFMSESQTSNDIDEMTSRVLFINRLLRPSVHKVHNFLSSFKLSLSLAFKLISLTVWWLSRRMNFGQMTFGQIILFQNGRVWCTFIYIANTRIMRSKGLKWLNFVRFGLKCFWMNTKDDFGILLPSSNIFWLF